MLCYHMKLFIFLMHMFIEVNKKKNKTTLDLPVLPEQWRFDHRHGPWPPAQQGSDHETLTTWLRLDLKIKYEDKKNRHQEKHPTHISKAVAVIVTSKQRKKKYWTDFLMPKSIFSPYTVTYLQSFLQLLPITTFYHFQSVTQFMNMKSGPLQPPQANSKHTQEMLGGRLPFYRIVFIDGHWGWTEDVDAVSCHFCFGPKIG